MTINLQNESNEAYRYGSFYRVETMQDGKWYMVNYPENTFEKFPYFNDMGYTLDPKEMVTQQFSIETYGLYLPAGNYRLTKTFLSPFSAGNEITLSVPFEVIGEN
ncbi:immunoglobulin-like domain-containing protein [Allobacillus saliphilus]|uniref:immunoglobulin-like domain-containing protein n=2 Tax=Allobacillus TaxID=1400133 RepID=UPI001BADC2A8|nr:immunoglobulin-like domain-containing protein [Allobacillus saliphilus]